MWKIKEIEILDPKETNIGNSRGWCLIYKKFLAYY